MGGEVKESTSSDKENIDNGQNLKNCINATRYISKTGAACNIAHRSRKAKKESTLFSKKV
jgi:hypothetical protein